MNFLRAIQYTHFYTDVYTGAQEAVVCKPLHDMWAGGSTGI